MSKRKFEQMDSVRIKQRLFGLPMHTIGKVVMVCSETVHVLFEQDGVLILSPEYIELVPQVVHFEPQQLSLFGEQQSVLATNLGDKLVVAPFVADLSEYPANSIVTTPRKLRLAYISTTNFDDFLRFIGLEVYSGERH